MAESVGARLTEQGKSLLAKAVAGKQLTFLKGALGDAMWNGSMQTPTIEQQEAFTQLINKRVEASIIDMSTQASTAKVVISVDNSSTTTGFQISEIGLFARDPDTGNEILYAYIFAGSQGDILPDNDGIPKTFTYEIQTLISNAANVTAVISPSYDLPTASTATKGGVRIGSGLKMDGEVLSCTVEGGDPAAGFTTNPNVFISLSAGTSVVGSDNARIRAASIRANDLFWTSPDATVRHDGNSHILIGEGSSIRTDRVYLQLMGAPDSDSVWHGDSIYANKTSIQAIDNTLNATGNFIVKGGGSVFFKCGTNFQSDVTLSSADNIPTATTLKKGVIAIGSGFKRSGDSLSVSYSISDELTLNGGAEISPYASLTAERSTLALDKAKITGDPTFEGQPRFKDIIRLDNALNASVAADSIHSAGVNSFLNADLDLNKSFITLQGASIYSGQRVGSGGVASIFGALYLDDGLLGNSFSFPTSINKTAPRVNGYLRFHKKSDDTCELIFVGSDDSNTYQFSIPLTDVEITAKDSDG